MPIRAGVDLLVHVTEDLFIPAGTLGEIHGPILSRVTAASRLMKKARCAGLFYIGGASSAQVRPAAPT
jgi:hypothetical protein